MLVLTVMLPPPEPKSQIKSGIACMRCPWNKYSSRIFRAQLSRYELAMLFGQGEEKEAPWSGTGRDVRLF